MYTLFQSYFLQCLPTHICFLIILCLYKLSLYYLLLIWVHNISFLLPSSSLQSMFTNSHHLIFSFHIFSDWVLLLLIVCPHHLSLASLAFSAKSTTHVVFSFRMPLFCSPSSLIMYRKIQACFPYLFGKIHHPGRHLLITAFRMPRSCSPSSLIMYRKIQACFPYLFGKIYHPGPHLLISSFRMPLSCSPSSLIMYP